MHDIEPYFKWRDRYTAEEDERSPFYAREYSEFYFTNAVYDHYIHPQWDEIGSSTLYIKLLIADYQNQYCVIELIGEWNDCINNDIMHLKHNVIDVLIDNGIMKFILVGENVFNFHYDGDDYYEEWFQDLEEGWIAAVNFQEHVLRELTENSIDLYLNFGGNLDDMPWRTLEPLSLFKKIESVLKHRLT